MLAGIYYGAMYGGSTTSILINVPGETASVITCIDGYKMAQQGRAGPALAIAAHRLVHRRHDRDLRPGADRAAARARRARLRPAGVRLADGVRLRRALATSPAGRCVKALMMVVVGLILGTHRPRPGHRQRALHLRLAPICSAAIEFVAVAIGVFGLGEILVNAAKPPQQLERRRAWCRACAISIRRCEDLKRSIGAILRGTGIGFFIGLIPGPAPVIATYASYTVEKRRLEAPRGVRQRRDRGRRRAGVGQQRRHAVGVHPALRASASRSGR